MMNKVPKVWAEKDTYCQMVHNTDPNNPDYDIIPRIWAFEISTVIDNTDILFFSKIMSKMWPDAGAVVARLKNFVNDADTMSGPDLKAKYQTRGRRNVPPKLSKDEETKKLEQKIAKNIPII